MADTSGFDAATARRVLDMVRKVEGGAFDPQQPPSTAAPFAPETLWALTPTGGIPARNVLTLGNATCDLYRDVLASWGSTTRQLQAVTVGGTQITRVVHNAMDRDIEAGVYVPITRTKHGAWLAVPECPCDCTIYTTGFGEAADLDDWTVTGTGSVTSAELTLSGTGTVAKLDTVHPQYPYPPKIRVSVKGGTGAEIRIFLSFTPSTDGIIIELRPDVATGCGDLDIYQLASSVETLISGTHGVPGLVADEWHDVAACYDPRDDSITVRIRTAGGRYTTILATISGHTYGAYAALGTGAAHTGTAYFDNFKFERLWYYGDTEQDDWGPYGGGAYYYDQTIIECGTCRAPGCIWIDAEFTADTDYYSGDTSSLCEWSSPGSYWEIDGDDEVLRSLAAHTMLHGLANPDETHDQDELTCRFKALAAGDIIELIVCATDTSNYLAAQVQVGTGSGSIGIVKLVQYTAGSPSTISQVHHVNLVEAGEWYNLWLYYDGYSLTARLTGDSEDTDDVLAHVETAGAVSCGGRYVGIGTDSAGMEISSFRAYWCSVAVRTLCYEYRAQIADQFGGNGATLDSNWTQVSGDAPAIVAMSGSSDLTLAEWAATEAGVILSLDPVQPSIDDTYRVTAAFLDDYINTEATGTGAKVGIIFAADSAGSDYYLAEVELVANADWTIALYRVASGTPTLLDSRTFTETGNTRDGDGWITLGVCWYYGAAIFSLYYAGVQIGTSIVWKADLTAYGRHYGVSVDATATYAARASAPAFIKIVDDRSEPACPPCNTNCSFCDDNEQPNLIIATVAGIVDPATLYWVVYGSTFTMVWGDGWSTMSADHYCVPLDTECYWEGPNVPMDCVAVGLGTVRWCGRVRVWFETVGSGIYLKAAVWIIPNLYYSADCSDVPEVAWNTAYTHPYGKYTFSKLMVTVGNTIDCFHDLDGETMTSDQDAAVSITLQVPG